MAQPYIVNKQSPSTQKACIVNKLKWAHLSHGNPAGKREIDNIIFNIMVK